MGFNSGFKGLNVNISPVKLYLYSVMKLCTHSLHFLSTNPATDLLWYLNSKICAYHSVVLMLLTNLVPSSKKNVHTLLCNHKPKLL